MSDVVSVATSGPTWETLGYIVGAVGLGAGILWRAFAAFVPRKEYDKLVARMDDISMSYVSKETLRLQLEPIIQEQATGARSVRKMADAFEALQKMFHRLDKSLTAIAVHLKVELDDRD